MIVLTTSRVCSSKPPLSGCSENAMAAIDDEKIHIEKRSVIERNTIIQIVLNFIRITFSSKIILVRQYYAKDRTGLLCWILGQFHLNSCAKCDIF